MKAYDVYGIDAPDLDSARDLVEARLGIRLEARESSYRGGDYYKMRGAGDESFILQRNYDPIENEWNEPEDEDKAFLLFVEETDRSAELTALLTRDGAVVLIRHDTV